MEALISNFSPIDILFSVFGFITGSLTLSRWVKNNPYRNLSIFLQVSLLIIKMAKSYYDAHPEAKEKLNAQIRDRLDRISDQLYEYMSSQKKPDTSGPVG